MPSDEVPGARRIGNAMQSGRNSMTPGGRCRTSWTTPRRAKLPREAGRRPAGNARRLDAEFADRATGPDDASRGEQVMDVLTRAYESRRRQSSQPQLYREAQALWMREGKPGRPPSLRQVVAFLRHDDMSQLDAPLPRWGARCIPGSR